jgi:hypothetical protein
MPHAVKSAHSSPDRGVIQLRRPKYRPRWTLAYLAASAVLWSAVIVLFARAIYWMSQQ